MSVSYSLRLNDFKVVLEILKFSSYLKYIKKRKIYKIELFKKLL